MTQETFVVNSFKSFKQHGYKQNNLGEKIVS